MDSIAQGISSAAMWFAISNIGVAAIHVTGWIVGAATAAAIFGFVVSMSDDQKKDSK